MIKKIIVTKNIKLTAGQFQNFDTQISVEVTCPEQDVTSVTNSMLNEIDTILADRYRQFDLKPFRLQPCRKEL